MYHTAIARTGLVSCNYHKNTPQYSKNAQNIKNPCYYFHNFISLIAMCFNSSTKKEKEYKPMQLKSNPFLPKVVAHLC